jgi:uncharacterized protein YggE
MKPIYLLLIVILLGQLLFAEEAKKEILFPDHHLCLEAAGKVVLKADKAVFSFDTIGYGASLREAVTKAKSKVTDITNALNQIGIPNDCFATGSFTSGKSMDASFWTDKKDYSAFLTTTIILRDLAKLDDAVLILTDKKVEGIGQIRYSLDNQAQARQQAREIALSRIAEQRDTIIRILGVAITDVLLIDEAPFDQLPWNTQMGGYSKGMNFSGASNTVTYYDQSEAEMDMRGNSGGFYTPDVTSETQVRVLYRIGLKEVK